MTNLKTPFTDVRSLYFAQALFNGCFYSVRAVFILYAISHFSLSEGQAISFFATFMTLCYGTSLIGGYIADQGLGVKNAIMMGGVLSSLGLACTLSPFQDLFFLGMALASLGSGYFKPNLLTAAGLIFENPKDPRKERVYSLLYMAMNLGSFMASLICGVVGKVYGWDYAIGLVVVGFMGAACLVYKTMRFHPSYQETLALSKWKLAGGNLLLIVVLCLFFKYQGYFHSLMGIIIGGSLIFLGKIYFQCTAEERKDVLGIMGYILFFTFLCTLYEQEATSFILFFEKAVNRDILGIVIPSPSFLSLSSLYVLICSPLLLFLSTRYLEKTQPLNGLIKVGCGFLCIAASFGVLALSAFQNAAHSISLIWIIGAIFLQTMGELWIAPVSFSKISQYAPPRFKSVLMSFWSMAIAYGHYFAGLIAQFSLGDPTNLSLGNSLEQYGTFFSYLGLAPLCVGLLLLLHQKSRARKGIFIKLPLLIRLSLINCKNSKKAA